MVSIRTSLAISIVAFLVGIFLILPAKAQDPKPKGSEYRFLWVHYVNDEISTDRLNKELASDGGGWEISTASYFVSDRDHTFIFTLKRAR